MANAKTIFKWYCEQLQQPQELLNYLAVSATLHWFGRVIEGRKNILHFTKKKLMNMTHVMKPAFRNRRSNRAHYSDSEEEGLQVQFTAESEASYVTPEKNVSSVLVSSKLDELMELDAEVGAPGAGECARVRQLSSVHLKGVLQLRRGSTRPAFERPCQLVISYTGEFSNNFRIKEIAYQDTGSCRKSLLAEFDNCFDDEGFISESN